MPGDYQQVGWLALQLILDFQKGQSVDNYAYGDWIRHRDCWNSCYYHYYS
ncbi:MAG: hypothetical protein VB070_04880 [Clostridiaceae bacterium]|nr:hypothetical protein [Clostridiaceae bacterium]